jgi:hypothetical protein
VSLGCASDGAKLGFRSGTNNCGKPCAECNPDSHTQPREEGNARSGSEAGAQSRENRDTGSRRGSKGQAQCHTQTESDARTKTCVRPSAIYNSGSGIGAEGRTWRYHKPRCSDGSNASAQSGAEYNSGCRRGSKGPA